MSDLVADHCQVLVTPYFEYVVYESVCLAVRERETGEWLDRHYALGQEISLVDSPVRRDHHPDLLIHASFTEVQIGPVLAVEYPSGAVLDRLTSRATPISRAS